LKLIVKENSPKFVSDNKISLIQQNFKFLRKFDDRCKYLVLKFFIDTKIKLDIYLGTSPARLPFPLDDLIPKLVLLKF